MLTRLRVKGFKNLVDVDVRFGPFTCIAGPNGVGKSNLFDAILFLRELADKPFVEAADSIRGGDADLLFTVGSDKMELTAEMLIPPEGTDEFGQQASANSTFVEYTIRLRLRRENDSGHGSIELDHEQLDYIKQSEAPSRLGFPHAKLWRNTVVRNTRRSPHYISTNHEEGRVKRHQDQTPQVDKLSLAGRALEYNLASLPRSVLSSARNAHESRTAVLVRREMQSWRLLQLEPSAMRQADDIRAPDHIASNGSHLPATPYRLVNSPEIGTDVGIH